MKNITHFFISLFIGISLVAMFSFFIDNGDMQLLNPKGIIAQKQSYIIIGALLLALIIGILVIGGMFFIALRFKEDTPAAEYDAEWKASKSLVFIWWLAPTIIIFLWAIIGLKTTYSLDPQVHIPSNKKPVKIQVVAIAWKWLFFYPEEHIATVNFIQFPVNTPIEFQVTADNTPYSSFWIPSLGSQIYAMNGMETHLNLMASSIGTYSGQGTELNGDGFSGMKFEARSSTQVDYINWVENIRKKAIPFDGAKYEALAKPSTNNHTSFYAYTDENIFQNIINKFMAPSDNMQMNTTKTEKYMSSMKNINL